MKLDDVGTKAESVPFLLHTSYMMLVLCWGVAHQLAVCPCSVPEACSVVAVGLCLLPSHHLALLFLFVAGLVLVMLESSCLSGALACLCLGPIHVWLPLPQSMAMCPSFKQPYLDKACACDGFQVEAEMARSCQAAGDSVAAMDAYMKLAAKKDRLSKVRGNRFGHT